MGGGNAANVAVCLSRLGISTSIVSKIGRDEIGHSILKEFQSEGVGTSNI